MTDTGRRNTLALGEAICLALEAAIPEHMPEVRGVLRAQDLAGVRESDAITPALHVLCADEVLSDPGAGARITTEEQRWLVVVAVRAIQRTAREAAEQLAGELRGVVIDCLQDARLLPDWGPLYRITAPRPTHRPSGYSYYPLLWAATQTRGPTRR